jgi:hypothetical protein
MLKVFSITGFHAVRKPLASLYRLQRGRQAHQRYEPTSIFKSARAENMRVGSAKTVKKGIPELKSAGLITDAASGEPTLTDKGYKTSV